MSMDICGRDPHLNNLYLEICGKKDESILRFFKRSFKECCKELIEPEKLHYDTTDLKDSISQYDFFELKEFSIISKGLKLHCALWMNDTVEKNDCIPEHSTTPIKESRKPCFIYLHTNTRSLIDAVEILPLADLMCGHLLAFDFPGIDMVTVI